MRYQNKILGLLVISLATFIFGFNKNLTGAMIGTNYRVSILTVIGLSSFILMGLLMSTRKSIDALIIPTGEGKENLKRTDKALSEWDKNYIGKLIISGDASNPLNESERATIWRHLRNYESTGHKEVKPKDVLISRGKDSVENILYSFKKLKDAKTVGIVSYPKHLDRFEYIFNKAKDEGIIKEDIKLVKIPTHETVKEFLYGILANVKEYYNLRNGIKNRDSNKKESTLMKIGSLVKNIISGE